MQEISLATKEKQLDGLLAKVNEALQLKPGYGELVKLREALQAREKKFDADIEMTLDRARQLATACRFGEATSLLGRIPAARQSALIRDQLGRYDSLARSRAAAAQAMKAATPGTYAEACELANVYEILLQPSGISDPEFSAAVQGIKAALANESLFLPRIPPRTNRRTPTGLVAAGCAVTVVAAVGLVAGLWFLVSPWLRPPTAPMESSRKDDARELARNSLSIHTSEPELQSGLVEKSCLNGCLQICVPAAFASLSQQELEQKYRGYSGAKNAIEEWANGDGTVSVALTAVQLSDIPGSPNDLTAVQEFLDSQLRRNFFVRTWKTQNVQGREWRRVEFDSSVDSKDHQEAMAITIANGKLLSVTFKVPPNQLSEWLPVRDKLFQSLVVTCP
jgi:hypothetical protein